MPSFGSNSTRILKQLHPDLQRVAVEAVKHFDFSLICGHRNKTEQMRAYHSGASRAKYGQSPHNFKPALAFDSIPYPFQGWSVIPPFEEMGVAILDASKKVGVEITWGKGFKGLVDYPHFELTNWRNMKGTLP